MKQKYSKEELISILIKFNEEYHRSPAINDFRYKNPSSGIYIYHFGSWNNALKAAGLKTTIRGSKIKISNEDMIKKVKGFYKKNKRIPRAKDFPSTFCQRFGKWNKLLKEADLEITKRVDYSKKELLDFINDFYNKNKKIPSTNDFNKSSNNYPVPTTYMKKFGSWNNAIKEAGFEIQREKNYTEEKIINILKDFEKQHNRLPRAIDFNSTKPSYHIIMRELNVKNWSDVLNKVGFIKSKWAKSDSLTYKWEKFVEEIIKKIYPDAIIKKEFWIEGKLQLPDTYIPSKKLIIDAKLSNYFIKGKSDKQFNYYSKITNNIEFWCLHKLEKQKELPVKYVYAEEIYSLLKQKGLNELSKRCNSFINLDESIRKETGMWTKDLLIKEIHRFVKEYEKVPTTKDIETTKGYPSANTYKRVFGYSFVKVKKDLGYQISKYVKETPYNKKEIKKRILKFVSKYGRRPEVNEFKHKYGLPGTHTVYNLFGSLHNCLEYCGLKSHIKFWKDEELLDILKDYYSKYGKVPTSKEFKNPKNNYPTMSLYQTHFGGWNNALLKAGLPLKRRVNWTKEELIKILKDYHKKYGKTPASTEFDKAGSNFPSVGVYQRVFGNWKKAIKAADLKPIRMYRSDEELIKILQLFYEKNERVPSMRDFNNSNKKYPSSEVYRKHFGNWNNAIKKAGLKPNRIKVRE